MKTILVDKLLDLYDKTGKDEHMLLAERADEAYQILAKYPNSRNLLKRCMEKAVEKYREGNNIVEVTMWVEKVFTSEETYNRLNTG